MSDGIDLAALSLGLFGIADFLVTINRVEIKAHHAKVSMKDMRPTKAELKQAFVPMLRGTAVGCLFGAMPGTGPTITTFIAYALERKIAKDPSRFGKGAIEGVAAPEAGRTRRRRSTSFRRCRSASPATR